MNTIEAVIQNYFKSYMEANDEGILESFHPETRLYSVSEGKLDRTEMADWVKNLRARREKGDIRQGELQILSVDSIADAAVAKVAIRMPNIQFTDFLSLLKVENRWKIVGKIYSASL